MNKKRFKICFIHPDLGIGGAERLILDLAGALASSGHEIIFLTNHFDSTHAFDELKSELYPVEVYGDWLPRSIFGKFQALCAYIRMVYLSIAYIIFGRANIKADLYFTDLIPVANPFLKLAGEKVIYYCHHPDLLASTPGGTLKQIYRKPLDWLEMKATAYSDLIVVNSEYTASVFRRTFPEIKHSLYILYPTIASSYQTTVESLQTVKSIEEILPDNKLGNSVNTVFLSVNRFHPAKRLELAVLAMDKLRSIVTQEEWAKTVFILAGGYDPQSVTNAETYDRLTELTKSKNLEDKIIFLKSPSDRIKAELLNSCTCLVYTPVNEHFGIVPLEAMMVSKPVIAVDSGGPRETVENDKTGYLCQPTPDSMAQCMVRILREDAKSLGLRGKKRLEEKFSYENFKKQVQLVVTRVTDNSKKNI